MRLNDLIPWASRETAPARAGGDDHPVVSLQREVNRLFDDMWGGVGRPFGSLGPAFGVMAATDMVETDTAIEVTLELPGMDEPDLDISVNRDMLVIKGEKKVERQEEKTGTYLAERSYGTIHRVLRLPDGVDAEAAKATFAKGVLTITLPKTKDGETSVKTIAINA